MKTLKMLLIAMISLAGIAIANNAHAQPGFRANISFNTFYNELSPHGRWMSMPRYGQVWIFNQPGFRPYYSNGQWEDTDLGLSWSSDYPWGWATFHYGRWEFDPAYGWFWIPGYEYAPAWVIWSEADDYYGWAPLGFGIDINVSIGRIPSSRWIYAPRGRIGYARIDRYCVPPRRAHVYYRRQQPIVNVNVYNNVRYDRGPSRNYNSGSRPDYRRSNSVAPRNDRGGYGQNNNRPYNRGNNPGNNRRNDFNSAPATNPPSVAETRPSRNYNPVNRNNSTQREQQPNRPVERQQSISDNSSRNNNEPATREPEPRRQVLPTNPRAYTPQDNPQRQQNERTVRPTPRSTNNEVRNNTVIRNREQSTNRSAERPARQMNNEKRNMRTTKAEASR